MRGSRLPPSEKDLMPEGSGLRLTAKRLLHEQSEPAKKSCKLPLTEKVSDFVPADRDHLLDTLGIRMDPRNATVWANSLSESEGRGELLHF